jgi:hypothetical protein
MDHLAAIGLAFIGFGPAVLLLYILLYRYEGMFSEKKLFLFFAVGMVAGMAVAAAHSYLELFYLLDLTSALLILVIGLSLLEELIKAIILNYPKFLLKHETPYFGAGLGLGMGSMIVMALGQESLRNTEVLDTSEILITGGILLLYSFNMAFLHGSNGVLVGYGSATGDIKRYVFIAILVHMIFNLFYLAFLVYRSSLGYGALGFLVAALIFTVYIFYRHIYTHILPDALPDKLKSKRRRRLRTT